MRIGLRGVALAIAAAALLGGCNRFGGGGDGDAAAEKQDPGVAREDSARLTAKALQDSGVSVDTQTIDTGAAQTTHVDDN
ncbi:MAG TPA: hypothetical protein VF771_07190 [Longimicrobiaceae bacterium]